MLPLLPKRSHLSGATKVPSDNGLWGIAIVATSFINLNKYSRYRKNFSDLSGNTGNKVKFVCIGDCNNKKTRPLKPSSQCKYEVKGVNNVTS
jgi:hypothetical protein